MAHQITIRAGGHAEMAYTGTPPSHMRGQALPAGADIAAWQVGAGMDFTIKAAVPTYRVGASDYTITDRVVLYRSDTGLPLGIVSTDYKIVQPRDVLAFFEDLIHGLGLELETAGTLFGGRRFWALAKIGEQALLNHDRIKGYLLLSSTADGSRRTTAKLTANRVVCNNNLTIAHAGAGSGGETAISHATAFNAAQAKRALSIAPKSFEQCMASIRQLASTPISKGVAERRAAKVFGENSRAAGKVMTLFEGEAVGHGKPGFTGTAWGWLNCVTEYVDHHAFAKSPSHRLDNSLFGRGDAKKTAAWRLALELAR